MQGPGRSDAVRGRRGRTGGGQGGGPLAKIRQQTNCGSNRRPLSSCAFPIGDSKRVGFIRAHTRSRANSRRMTARGAAVPTILYKVKKRLWKYLSFTLLLPQKSACLTLLACIRYRKPRSRPVRRRRHLHVRSECSRLTCGRRWPRGCVPAVLQPEQPHLGRAQRPFHLHEDQQRLLPHRLLTSDCASDARAWA